VHGHCAECRPAEGAAIYVVTASISPNLIFSICRGAADAEMEKLRGRRQRCQPHLSVGAPRSRDWRSRSSRRLVLLGSRCGYRLSEASRMRIFSPSCGFHRPTTHYRREKLPGDKFITDPKPKWLCMRKAFERRPRTGRPGRSSLSARVIAFGLLATPLLATLRLP
jgi:hypothetical protein